MITLSCPTCQVKLKVQDELAGKKVRCPQCKKTTDIPSGTQAFEPAKPSLAEDATVPPRPLAATDAVLEPPLARHCAVDDEAPREALEAAAHYEVEGEIARGGMGAIMRAVDQDIRREVAVKFLLNHADEKMKARFVEEAQITGQLEHPNIVPIHQLGVHPDGRCFFSMKMVKGNSLAEILKQQTEPRPSGSGDTYTLGRLLNIFVSICNALSYAHSRNVIHRDLKPANVMVGDFGEVYVMDWGLAKVLGESEAEALARHDAQESLAHASASDGSRVATTTRATIEDLTQAGAIMGTPAYMPPEQANAMGIVDQRSDIYSLGAMLYEMMTLTPPVGRDGDMLAILVRVIEGQIEPPSKRSPERARAGWIPSELSAVAMKALALKPADRYQTVEALRRDLELFLEGRSVSAKQDTIREMVWKLIKRNKGVSIATAAAAVVLTVVGLWSLIAILSANARTRRADEAYVAEQQEKEKRTKEAVPAFLKAARLAVERKEIADALAQVSVALDYDADNAEALLLKGQLLVSRKEFAAAANVLDRYVKLRPADKDTAKLAKLCVAPDTSIPSVQDAMASILIAQKQPGLAIGFFQSSEKQFAAYRKQLQAGGWLDQSAMSLWLDKDHGLAYTANGGNRSDKYLDLAAPFRGIPLQDLRLTFVRVQNLEPLRGMPLNSISLHGLPFLSDLAPLKDMPLTDLKLSNCPLIDDLSPLRGLRLSSLELRYCPRIKNLTSLKDVPLTQLTILGQSNVAGWVSPVEDLSPLRGMPIRHLRLEGTKIKDIEPLREMDLQTLNLSNNYGLKDIAPLKGMALTTLNISHTGVVDLASLQGMQLTSLECSASGVKNLGPLRGMPLTHLGTNTGFVKDLTPLEGMSLETISIPYPAKSLKGLEVLRAMTSLRRIHYGSQGSFEAAEFWRKLDAGEFK